MSKKLLIAVLTLGLLFTLSGAVIGSESPTPEGRETVYDAFEPSGRAVSTFPQHADDYFRPADPQVQAISPSTLFPPPYYCDFIDYSGGAFTGYFEVPDGNPCWYHNMRFTSSAGYTCTLITASIGVYPPGFVGTPDLEVLVWDDDGTGLPGAVRAIVTVPYASLPTGGPAYVTVDLTSYDLVYSDGEEYHIGINTPNSGGGNRMTILCDDGTVGTGRQSLWYEGGFWVS